MDIETTEILGNNLLGGTDQRSCSILPTKALAKH